jgi:hypothetical protein
MYQTVRAGIKVLERAARRVYCLLGDDEADDESFGAASSSSHRERREAAHFHYMTWGSRIEMKRARTRIRTCF